MSRFSAVINSTTINGAVGRRCSPVLNQESLSSVVFVDEGGRVMAMMLKAAVMSTSSSSPRGKSIIDSLWKRSLGAFSGRGAVGALRNRVF